MRACKLAWRRDSKALAMVGERACTEEVGTLVTLPLSDTDDTQAISSKGDNPSIEPLAVTP